MDEKGAYYLSRWKHQAHLYQRTRSGEFVLFDLVAFVQPMKSAHTELTLYFQHGADDVRLRLIVHTVPERQVIAVLRNAVTEMMRQCLKGKQTKRQYPFDMIEQAFS